MPLWCPIDLLRRITRSISQMPYPTSNADSAGIFKFLQWNVSQPLPRMPNRHSFHTEDHSLTRSRPHPSRSCFRTPTPRPLSSSIPRRQHNWYLDSGRPRLPTALSPCTSSTNPPQSDPLPLPKDRALTPSLLHKILKDLLSHDWRSQRIALDGFCCAGIGYRTVASRTHTQQCSQSSRLACSLNRTWPRKF
jgi:hypothetical protein